MAALPPNFPPPPKPLTPDVVRVNPDGTPTPAQINQDNKVENWLKKLIAALS